MNSRPDLYKRHRFRSKFIQYAVWLYHRFKSTQQAQRFLAVHADGIQPFQLGASHGFSDELLDTQVTRLCVLEKRSGPVEEDGLMIIGAARVNLSMPNGDIFTHGGSFIATPSSSHRPRQFLPH